MRGAFFLSEPGRYIELTAAAQPLAAGAGRSLARRIWHGRSPTPDALRKWAEQLARESPQPPGRVHQLGRFEDESALAALRVSLPADLAAALRAQLEWYGCRGAGFHTDAHYDAVIFGAWCLAGPPRDIAFGGLRIPCTAGDLVVFDPFQPHAVLDPGQALYRREHYADAPASVFAGFELELSEPVRNRFGIGPVEPGAFSIGSATAVDAETGRIVR
jgi:hypothetical protein